MLCIQHKDTHCKSFGAFRFSLSFVCAQKPLTEYVTARHCKDICLNDT